MEVMHAEAGTRVTEEEGRLEVALCMKRLPEELRGNLSDYSRCVLDSETLAAMDGCGVTEGLNATDADCVALGDKFVELFLADIGTPDSAEGREILRSAAGAGREEVIKQCKANPPLNASMSCALQAQSLDELERC